MKRPLLHFVYLCLLAILLPLNVTSAAPLAQAAVYTVNTTDDLNDGVCGATHCSLREAITAANLTLGPDTITFNIAGSGLVTIAPTLELPSINDTVVIDGTTQPGYTGTPLIELDGTNAGIGVYGLRIFVGGSTVRGLAINRFRSGGILVQSSSNIIENNVIGLGGSPFGVVSYPPQSDGIYLGSGSSNRITGNIISGNSIWGISAYGSSGNFIKGNLIGTDPTGTADMGNGGGAILLYESANNRVGGPNAADRNILSGNQGGIEIDHPSSTGNIIQNNYIGTDITGSLDIGNDYEGIVIRGAPGTQVLDNVISGNGAAGVRVEYVSSALIQGNTIGLTANGATALPNIEGVHVGSGATGVRLQWNDIGGNTNLGIDLSVPMRPADGVTPNDLGDADTGPNNLQNYPVRTSASATSTTQVTGTLNSAPSTTYRIEFFSNTTCDASGYGEGEVYQGFAEVTTDGSGNANISHTIAAGLSGKYITATATDPAGNTSEFSACVLVVVPPPTTPTNLTASQASRLQIFLTWSGPSSEDLSYEVERSLDGAAGWTLVGTAQFGSYVDSNLACETTYYYRVRAYRGSDGQYSGYSNVASATTGYCSLLANWSFETDADGDQLPDGWPYNRNNVPDFRTCDIAYHELCSFQLNGRGQERTLSQTVSISGSAGDPIDLTLYARGSDLSGNGVHQVDVIVYHTDGSTETHTISLPLGTYDWQSFTLSFDAAEAYSQVEVVIRSSVRHGTAWVDGVALVIDLLPPIPPGVGIEP